MFNKEYFDAALYARTLWETITLSRDSHIPEHLREQFTARGAIELARSLLRLAEDGGMPPEERREAGKEAIMLARRALEIRTQLQGAENEQVADVMGTLAEILGYFNDVDDDEVPRLHEQAKAIHARMQGKLSPNVAVGEKNLGVFYYRRARRAHDANDLDRELANLELALPHFREAARIYRAINHMEDGDDAAQNESNVISLLRDVRASRVATASTG